MDANGPLMDANGREWTLMDANGREWTRMDVEGWVRIVADTRG